ncbi:hypothetical protein HLK56_16080 [Streptomyces sp. G9]
MIAGESAAMTMPSWEGPASPVPVGARPASTATYAARARDDDSAMIGWAVLSRGSRSASSASS